MTFEELEHTLPNGFHDAGLREFRFDFLDRVAVMSMDVLVGGPDDVDPELRRGGTVRVEPVYLFFVEPPDPKYSFIPDGTRFKVQGDGTGRSECSDGQTGDYFAAWGNIA